MKYIDVGFIFLIIGSIIGAGFSSGKEIVVFFSGSGKFSFIIIPLITLLLYLILKSLIMLGKNINSNNIKDINKKLFKKSYKFFDIFILFGIFIFITAMVAGLNSIGTLIFNNIHFPILTIVSIFFSLFIVNIGYEAIKVVNKFLMPIVIAFIIYLSVASLFFKDISPVNINLNFNNFIIYICLGICYISYNVVFSTSLIIKTSKNFTKKQVKLNALIVSLILGTLILLINSAILRLNISIFQSDLPMLNIAFNINNVVGYLFGFILWFSVLTSLISSLYMLTNAFKMNKYLSSSIILTLAFILSNFGFNYIVKFFYPLQGIIGLIFIGKTFIYNKNNKINESLLLNKKTNPQTRGNV